MLSHITYLLEKHRNASTVVHNFSKSGQTPYDEIAKVFTEDNFPLLRETILLKKDALDKDNNYGLAKQVVEAWKTRRLLQLSQVYVTLPLERVAQELVVEDVPAVTSFLFKATTSSIFSCKINHDTGIVKFKDEENDSVALDVKKRLLNQQLGRAMMDTTVFSDKMRELQKAAITSTSYIMKNTSGGGSSSGTGGVGGIRSSWTSSSVAAGAMDIEY